MNYRSHAFRMLPATERVLLRSEWQGPCVVYTGPLYKRGYGQITADGKNQQVHRFMWEQLVGPIPAGMTLDHRCRNPACWWTDHLEVVSHGENVLRGHGPTARHARLTHCPQGHEYTPENTRIQPTGGRICRACHKVHSTNSARKRRGAVRS